MKRRIRYFIQKLIIIFSFPPLTYLFRMVYDLSITIAVFLLKQVEGVLTIYLRRGVAKNEIMYGLSDIDLLVILDENKEKQAVELARERVTSIYNKLSRIIPLFGEVGEELGIYSVSEFFELYQDYDFYKHRFNEGKYTWKLLFGKDLVKDLPELPDKELYLPATEELKVWWPILSIELDPNLTYPQFKRKDLWYKALSEASKSCLFICHGENILRRDAALYRIREYLAYEHRGYIDKVQSYVKDLTSKEDLIVDELMRLFIYLTGKAFSEMERKVYGDSKGRKAIINTPNYHDLILDSNVLTLIEKLKINIGRELGSYLDDVALIPQVEFSMDILLNSDIDCLDLVLIQKDIIPVDKLRWFNSLFKESTSLQQIEPFITDGTIALSIQAERHGRCIKSPKQCSLFFSLLSSNLLKLLQAPAKIQDREIQFDLPPNFFENIILKRAAKLDKIISDKYIYKIKTLDFLRFFWTAARTKLLAHSIDNDKSYVPVTSKQILEMLIKFSPKDASWLNCLYTEYSKELSGKESEAYRYISNSVAFLRAM